MQYNESDTLVMSLLDTLTPHQRTCAWNGKHPYCMGVFMIEKEDIEFLKMLRVLPPNFCPICRRMRRLTHLNTTRLFSIPCEKAEHSESLISVFPKECPFPVWDVDSFSQIDDYYLSCVYDTTKTPYQYLLEMRTSFPMPQFLNRELTVVNSPYSSGGRDLKNGYFVFGCFNTEDAWYTNLTKSTKQIMDSRSITHSEWVYQSCFSDYLYKCSFVYFSKNCIDSMFLYDCRNCSNCFGCVNLRNKSYCIYNVQYTKEEYDAWIETNSPFSRSFLNVSVKKFYDLVQSLPINASGNIQAQHSMGVLIENSLNVVDVVDSYNSQDIRHSDGVISNKDSMDILFSGGSSHHLYMCANVGSQSSNVKFSISSKYCTDSEFIFNSKNCSHCFMCFGLQNKSYCILNKQYTKEEYFIEVDKLKTLMVENGEYSDGVGMEFSAQAYNMSLAQFAFPLTQEQVISLGGYWASEPQSNIGNTEIISVNDLPETIIETDDSIVEKAIMCPVTQRPFKIIKSELDFLRYRGLPVPTTHPSERMKNNYISYPEGKMYGAVCTKCQKDIQSIYNPKDSYILYCDVCFRNEVA